MNILTFRGRIGIAGSALLGLVWCVATGTAAGASAKGRAIQVAGTGTDLEKGAIVHSKKQTAQGVVQKSTEIVELQGDLVGKVLYQVTSTTDLSKETLVNTGDQVFSGSVAGSDPVLIRDSKFRFEANLKTGTDSGEVYLTDHISGPNVACTLHVVGTGRDSDGNPIFRYTGNCTFN